MSSEKFADVIAIPVANLESLSDQEIISIYITSLIHPNVSKKPEKLSQAIIDYSGNGEESSSEQNQEFQAKVRQINRATATPSNQEWDNLIDPSNEGYDDAFSEIVLALQDLRGEESKVREALFVLMDIRVSSLRLKLYEDADLRRIVAFLVAKPDARING
jgi:hypothetical protein